MVIESKGLGIEETDLRNLQLFLWKLNLTTSSGSQSFRASIKREWIWLACFQICLSTACIRRECVTSAF